MGTRVPYLEQIKGSPTQRTTQALARRSSTIGSRRTPLVGFRQPASHQQCTSHQQCSSEASQMLPARFYPDCARLLRSQQLALRLAELSGPAVLFLNNRLLWALLPQGWRCGPYRADCSWRLCHRREALQEREGRNPCNGGLFPPVLEPPIGIEPRTFHYGSTASPRCHFRALHVP
jgi:hypothetical protein